MAEPKLKQAKNWGKEKCFQEAIKAVLDKGESQRHAAELYGVSRQALGPRVAKAKADRDESCPG